MKQETEFKLKSPETYSLWRLTQVAKYADNYQQYQYIDLISIRSMTKDQLVYLLGDIVQLDECPFKRRISGLANSRYRRLLSASSPKDIQGQQTLSKPVEKEQKRQKSTLFTQLMQCFSLYGPSKDTFSQKASHERKQYDCQKIQILDGEELQPLYDLELKQKSSQIKQKTA